MTSELNRLLAAHNYAAAQSLSQSILQTDPNNVEVLSLHAFILLQQGDAPGAVNFARKAAQLSPIPPLIVNLARTQLHSFDIPGALATLDPVLEKWPDNKQAWICAVEALMTAGQNLAAANRATEGLKRLPTDREMAMVSAFALHSAARHHEAIAACRGILPRFPTDPWVLSTIANFSNYDASLTPTELLEVHRKYGKVMSRHFPVAAAAAAPADREGRRLRIGFISPDFRSHSVSFFVEPIFRNYDREKFEVFGYYTKRVGDAVTARLQGLVDHWQNLANLPAQAVARALSADRLDLVIDLAGHTEGHSLEALHLRPAPRLASYLGYPNTTGLAAINFRIVDGYTDPVGSESLSTEKLVRLDPCFVCYQPPVESPVGGAAVGDGAITFGSFNALKKINDPLIALWSRVMAAVPGSRLLLKCRGLQEEAMAADLHRRFEACGISADRVELLANVSDVKEHLAAYGRVHIGLDTFPYHGTTTTCEAMWMGVPVVTLAGGMHAARVGVSLLMNVGLPELIAKSEDEYVEIAVGLAKDRERLNGVRAGLRARMGASALCDGVGFCRRFEGAMEAMAV